MPLATAAPIPSCSAWSSTPQIQLASWPIRTAAFPDGERGSRRMWTHMS
ncbi:hypothetical protein HMPREF0307_00598 [Corynebacterium sp. DNF00584]|nr:hypothetical protein HMPREF0307_00598 [Corynebacterium sp. DNF00584]